MKILYTIIISVFICTLGFAQSSNYCGTSEMSKRQVDELTKFAADGYPNKTIRGTYYVPVQFHLIAYNDGSKVYPAATLLDLLCELNDKYKPVGFYFYMAGDIDYIRDSNYYKITYYTGDALMSAYNVANVVNVYMVGDPAGNCGYYTPGNDAVAVAISCAAAGSTTLAHELGHYFSLPHPFMNVNGTAEYVDESNCKTAGDLFCDTKADFIDVRWTCPYTGTKTDRKGDYYHPDSSLYMCYSYDNCQSRFSTQQTNAMINDITVSRSWLYSTSYNTAAVDTVVPVAPATSTAGINSYPLKLVWNKAKNATRYLVEYSTSPFFLGTIYDSIVSDTFLYANKIKSNKNYYWRVRGFQPGNTCAGWSARSQFKTATLYGSGITELDNKATVGIYPNPVVGSEFMLNYNHPLGSDMQGTIDVMDINGRVVLSHSIILSEGDNAITLPASTANGTYIVRVHTPTGLYFNKLIQVAR